MRQFILLVLVLLMNVALPPKMTGNHANAQSVETINEILDWRAEYDAIGLDSATIMQRLDEADTITAEFDLGEIDDKEARRRLAQLEQDMLASGSVIAQRYDALPDLSAAAISAAPFLPDMLRLTRKATLDSLESLSGLIDLYRAYISSDGESANDKLLIASIRRILPPIELENKMIQLTLDQSEDRGTPGRNLAKLSIYSNELMILFLQSEINSLLGTSSNGEYQKALSILGAIDGEIQDGHDRTRRSLATLQQENQSSPPESTALLRRATRAFGTFEASLQIEMKIFNVFHDLIALQADDGDSLNHPARDPLLAEIDALILERLETNAERIQVMQQ